MDPLNSRRLQYCSEGDRHCQPVPEQNLNTTSTGSASSGNLTNSTDDSNIFNRTDVTAGSKNASCASDSNGLYKSNSSNKQNNSSNNGSDLVVVFQYQVQTSRSQTVISLQSNMSALLVIEKAISDLLVGNLFGDCASDRDVRRRSRDLDVARQQRDVPYYQNQYKSRHHPSDSENIRRRTVEQFNASNVGSLTGLSAAPADRLLPGRAAVNCATQLVPKAERCYLVDGAFTLSGWGNMSWATPMSTLAVKEAMDRGLWNSVHPDILSVHFVSDQQYASPPNQGNLPNPSSLDPTSNNTESGASRIVGDDVAVWPWIVLSIATFFLCCFMAWLVRLARQGKRRAPNKDITGQQQRQQQRVVQSRSLTFDSDGPAMSAGGTFIHHHPTKTVPPLDPIIGSFAGGLSFGDFPMSPTLSDPYSVDPFMHEDSGEQQQLQHIYVPPRSSDFDDKAYDAFDRLLKVVALQGNSSSSGSSSDGESEMRAVQSSD